MCEKEVNALNPGRRKPDWYRRLPTREWRLALIDHRSPVIAASPRCFIEHHFHTLKCVLGRLGTPNRTHLPLEDDLKHCRPTRTHIYIVGDSEKVGETVQ